MFIDHRKHGRGLGKQLLDLTIDDAKKLQCNKIRLSVYASNSPAYKIYQSRGFVEVERSKIIINNLADEKIVMVKDLYDA
jgi:ribosomal protein S18 acetylase RimI-like enzyme